MMPEETIQAAVDIKSKMTMPIHWAAFTLSLHSWTDPVERALKKAEELNVPFCTPKIGEPVIIGKSYPDGKWWRTLN